jgi:hypothetical protein
MRDHFDGAGSFPIGLAHDLEVTVSRHYLARSSHASHRLRSARNIENLDQLCLRLRPFAKMVQLEQKRLSEETKSRDACTYQCSADNSK